MSRVNLARRPPDCTQELRVDPFYLRRGEVIDRENRLIIDGFGLPVRLSYRGPYSEN